jgi:hypothetical protein
MPNTLYPMLAVSCSLHCKQTPAHYFNKVTKTSFQINSNWSFAYPPTIDYIRFRHLRRFKMKTQVLQTLHETLPHCPLCYHPAVFFHHHLLIVFSVPQRKIRRVFPKWYYARQWLSSTAAKLLGSRVRIPLMAWMFVSCVCCVLCR